MQRTDHAAGLASTANTKINNLITAPIRYFSAMALALAMLIARSANAQSSFIRITPTPSQVRITVAINSTNVDAITNDVHLGNGATNANFDVAGLPAGASYTLTDTNSNPLTSTTQSTNVVMTVYTTNLAEGLYYFSLDAGGLDTNGMAVTNSFPFILQVAYIWNGTLNGSNAWSTASSWLTGTPGAADDVVFTDIGAQSNNFPNGSGLPFTNSFVDTSVTINSLRFAQTGVTNAGATNPPPIYHHVQILPNKTLTITGTNGFSLLRDYFDEGGAGTALNTMNVTIDGAGGKMVVTNQSGIVSVLVGGDLIPTLNMSNLDTFVANVSRLGWADYQVYPNYRNMNTAINAGHDSNSYAAHPSQMSLSLALAKTNIINANFVDPSNYTNEMSRGYAFTLDNGETQGVGSSQAKTVMLGISNIFLLDGICFYGASGNGTTQFGPTNGSAIFRNTNGTGRVSVFTISDDGGSSNEVTGNIKGIVDFSGGTVDLMADRLYMARDRELIQTDATPNIQATMIIGKGSVNVNTAILGFQEHTKPDYTALFGSGKPYLNYCQGFLTVGNGGTLRVNGTLTLGYTADTNSATDAEQYNTFGQLNILSNSTVFASNIVVDGGLNYYDGANARQNAISINTGGTLVISNTIGSTNFMANPNPGPPGLALDTMTMQPSSVLTLFVTGATNVFVRNFVSTGVSPGTIRIASLPALPVYPTNLSLIAYSTASPVLQADMSLIGGTVQGYILNNSQNSSIDLFLTTNAPQTLVWNGHQNNNWDLSSTNWTPLGGGPATNFAMGDIAIFDDSSTVTNINVTDVVVPNQATNGVIITNSQNLYTFNSAGGSIAGTAKIVKEGTNDLIFNATEAGPMIITAGRVDVSGSIGSTLEYSNTVLNVMSGGSVNGLTETNSTVTVASGGAISSSTIMIGGSLVNDGTITVPGTSLQLSINNNAVLTNNSDGSIAINGTASPAAEVFAGCSLANFGAMTCNGGRLFVEGTYFGTGSFVDNVDAPSAYARLQMDSVRTGLLSPGTNPTNSIGNLTVGGRLDMHASGPNNSVGTFFVEVDTVNNNYDTITAARWNNIGCIWQMTNVNGTFQSGQSFQVLVNQNGTTVPNFVDTANIYPLVQPTIPAPGLQWNLTGIQPFGTIGVTNSTMIWDGSGSGTWDTNYSTGNWKNSAVYTNNQGAIFDDTASGTTTVTITNPVAPAGFNLVTNIIIGVSTNVVTNTPAFSPGIVVSNALKDYTFVSSQQTNRITGMTSIYKTGSGKLTILTSNDFTGGLVLDGGTLAFTNPSALGGTANQIYNELLVDNNATVRYFATNNQSIGKFVTINPNGATFEVSSNGAVFTLNQNILGTGALTKTGPGVLSLTQTGNAYPGGTIVNAGNLRLTAAAAGTGTLTLNNNTTLELTNASTPQSFTLTNAVNLAGAATAVTLQGPAITNIVSGPWSGGGLVTMTSTNSARLLVFNNDLTGITGTISFGNSVGLFRFNNSTNNAPCTGSASATFDLGTNSAKLSNVSNTNRTYNLGALAGGPNTTLSGSATNGGAAATTYSIGAVGSSTTFAGTIANGLDTVSVVKVGSGQLLLNGANTYNGPTTVNSGVLGGTGSIASALTVAASGTLSPGAPLGTFTVSNTAALAGTVQMSLNVGNSPSINSALAVTGTITATGALVVTNVGPNITNGTRFVLFNKAVTGFSPTTLPASNPSNTSTYNWQNNIGNDGSITLLSGGAAPAVNTNPTNITFSVSGGTLTLTWPGDHLGWQLLSNSVGLTSTNQWFPIGGSTATTQENMTFDLTKTNVFFRMTYPPLP